jgi:predicted transcriptional regulator of viral defense system
MKRDDALRAVGEYAAEQWGVFTAAQAELQGVGGVGLKRLVDAGLIESRGRGVYLISGAAAPEYELIKVAWLQLAPGLGAWERLSPGSHRAVVSHSSACLLHQLGDIPMPQAEFIVPERKTTRHADVRLRVDELAAADVVVVAGLPVTSVERTIADLLKVRADGGHVGRVVADALKRGLADRAALAERVAPHVRAYGLPAQASGAELLDALLAQAGETPTPVERALAELGRQPATAGLDLASWQAATQVFQQLAASAAVPHAELARSLSQIGRLDPAVLESLSQIGRLDPAVFRALTQIQHSLADSQAARVAQSLRYRPR